MDRQILFILIQLIKTDQESRLTPVKVQRKEAKSLDGDRIKADLSSKKTGGTCFHADINRAHIHKCYSFMGVKVKKQKALLSSFCRHPCCAETGSEGQFCHYVPGTQKPL